MWMIRGGSLRKEVDRLDGYAHIHADSPNHGG